MRRLWLTPFAFLALIAAYAVGLAHEFTKQGFRNLAAIVAAAAVFLFCYARGPQLARSKATIPVVIAALLALFPSYLTDTVIHSHMFAAMLGYSLLTVGIVLAARAKSTRAQRVWGHAALLLALLCGLIYGSRAQVLVTMLGYGFYWASHVLLNRRLGTLAIAGVAGVVAGVAVFWYASPRFDESLRRLDPWSWGYTGSPMRSGRETLFRATLAGIAEAPWWGHGPGVDITTLTDTGDGIDAGEETDAGDGRSSSAGAPEDAVCMTPTPSSLLRDCRLLLTVRNTLAGTRPESLWSWNFNLPLSRWQGVSIDGQPPRIVSIILGGVRLTGQIPPELGALDQLTVLSLDTNRLRGPIPPELGNLQQLKRLRLDSNALSGTVPATLGKLSQLEVLSLADNQLHGPVPAALAGLSKLRRLRLAGNEFSGPVPAALHRTAEHDLYKELLCQNALRDSYPELFEDCSALLAGRDELAGTGSLNWSRATPIYDWQGVKTHGPPPRIKGLRLKNAKLNGRIPEELSALDALEEIRLDGNMLVGQIPPDMGRLLNLDEVQLAGNDFSGMPPSQLFQVETNDLRGMLFCARTDTLNQGLLADCETLLGLRDTLAGQAQLNWRRGEPIGWWQGVRLGGQPLRIIGLHLQDSGLSGQLPAALGNLDRLITLWLDGNRLRGALPAELGQLQRLRQLRLDAALLDQGAPAAMCRLDALTATLADACARPAEPSPGLRTDIDALLAAQRQLDAGDVLNWQPTLSIESWDGVILAGEPRRVAALLLGRRGLAGQLPPELGRLTQLVELRLERNRLQGGIPAELGQLATLESLDLSNNALRGAIPPELGNLKQLLALNLAENRFTGTVPSELGALGRLVWLRLAGNDFAGDMPAALRNVADHDIDDDVFCLPSKRINPAQLEDCKALLAARDELAGNGDLNWRATTPLGAWQGVSLDGAPTRVVALNLAGMRLTGRIPAALGRLTALQSLVLDGNALSGSIPANLRRLPSRQTSGGQGSSATGGLPSARVAQSPPGFGLAVPPAMHGTAWGTTPCGFPAANRGLIGDCRTLLEARDTLAGAGRLNWSAALPAQAWQGVELGGVPERVVSLNLAEAGLQGRIPAALSRLSQLAALRLNDNGLRGGIPAELGQLANLQVLWLQNNSLDGPLPQQLIELPTLRVARLAGNELSGPLPRTHPALDHDLDDYLFCLPLATANAGLLEDCNVLLASRDALSGAAELNWRRDLALGRWQGVELGGDPPRIIGLDVSALGLTGQIPPEFGRLVELRRLAVGGNALTGPVPRALARLPNLEKLHLFRPQNTARTVTISVEARNTDPSALASAPSATTSANPHLSCTSYQSGLMADCEALLDMRDTLAGSATLNWHATVPIEKWPCIQVSGSPPRVTRLACIKEGLNGRLPFALGDLDALEILNLSSNALSGTIPPSLGRLSKLKHLNLTANQLTGAIPTELSKLAALESLLLRANRLTGHIPPTLADLPKLTTLRLRHNALSGCSPPPRLLGVQTHDLGRDAFHCLPLADGKAGLKRDAAILLAARDELAGQGELNWSAQTSVADWQGVTLADVESQGIIGVDLTGAGLTGRIPRQLSGLAVLQTLSFGGNQLTGLVPYELAQLPDLQELNLAGNSLTGILPPALLIGRPGLVVTGLASNSFAGPAQLERRASTQLTPSLVGARCQPVANIDMELLADCGTLLALRDALAGAGTLNWSAALPIAAWQGVTIGGEPERVLALDLPAAGLAGRIPAELGKLTGLRRLVLSENALTGTIPRELGELERLVELRLEGNALTGAVPPTVAIAADPDRRGDWSATASATPRVANIARGLGAGELTDGDQENAFATPLPAALRQIADHDLPPACPNVPRTNTGLLRDCESLLASRDALAGTAKLNWGEGLPMATWHGVTLGGSPLRVTALELPDAGLDGRLPPTLGSLEMLVTLRLDGNRLVGPIPPQLGELQRLENLALARNQLTGHIPAALGALPSLASLALGQNNFHAPAPPALRAVEWHDLDVEVFCPASGGDAPSLLSDCQTLLSVRDELAGRESLNWRRSVPLGVWAGVRLGGDPLRVEALELAGKGLDGRLPAALGNLDALLKLDLSGNALRGGLPAELAKLARLDELRLSDNRLSGDIPVALEALDLRVLRIAGNLLAAPPDGLRQLPDTDFGRRERCIGVPPDNPKLVEDCWQLLSLRDELAPGGDLSWSSEQPIEQWHGVRLGGTPPRVTALRLANLGLGGRLPAGLGHLSRLAAINLSNNGLTGPIPAELGKLRWLELLRLGRNRLVGPIPIELGQLPRLKVMNLAYNRLTGHVPAALAQLPALAVLRLQGNLFLDCSAPAALAASLPNTDFAATFLCHPLDWSRSLAPDAAALLAMRVVLAGAGALNWHERTPVPAWEGVTLSYGQSPRVERLELSGKALTGRIPREIGNLDALKTLHLDGNALTGTVPPELGKLTRLRSLRLDGNRLHGPLPQALGALNALTLLRLAGNSFEGLAPTALRQVQDHDLGFGPRCRPGIAGTTGLQRDCGVLLAVRDELAGDVKLNWGAAAPIDFWRGVTLGGAPPRVIALDLTNLGLTGSIPPRLGNLDALVSLRLGRNALLGTIPDTLGKLANLSELVLDGNALTGRIPGELGRLANLATLRLRNNRLHGAIPAELGRLGNLRQLALDNNALSGHIPRSLGELSALQELWLAGNELADATSHIQVTPTLSRAWRDASPAPQAEALAPAAGAGLPPSPTRRIAAPSQPPATGTELFCTSNGAGNAELFGDCTQLLGIGSDWGGASLLNWRVDVPIGRWKGIEVSGHPARVTGIDVSGLGLRGPLSRRLTRLSALETLRLADNQFSGHIPPRLGRLRALRTMALERNNLTGPVPTSIQNLLALSELRLNDNAMTGHLVDRLERLPSLSTMRLGGNNFLGCVPELVRGLGDRRLELDLDCGPTPWSKPPLFEDAAALMASRAALEAAARLNWNYDLPINAWQGVMVDGSPPRVVSLDLANMGLAGQIPSELHALSALVRLDLSGNALTGGVPPQLGQLSNLRTLSLSANRLTGELPKALDHLDRLAKIEFEGNDFVGCPPTTLRSRLHSAFLPLSLAHCPETWQYDTAGQVGGTLLSINNVVDQGRETHLAQGAHNLFLQMGLQTGLVGVGALGLLCMSLVFNLRGRLGRKVTPVQCLAAAGTAMAITHSAFDVFLLQYVMTVAVFVWMFLGIGTGLARSTQTEGEAQPVGDGRRIAGD